MLGTLFQKSSQTLIDLLFPPNCVHCKAADSWLCPDCFEAIPFINSTICGRCGTPSSDKTSSYCEQCANHPLQYVACIRVAAYYEDNPIRSAIHNLKYRNNKTISAILSDILRDTFLQYNLSADVIVPVPLHRSRLRERGYNQSELLAKGLGQLLRLPVNTVSLQRTRNTEPQMSLGAQERCRNVVDAFVCSNQQLEDKHILLVDDVCTTGSTLDACAAALHDSRAASVKGLTVAKAR